MTEASADGPIVVLIGPMGSGKSRIGLELADRWHAPLIDTDQRIAEAHGPIPGIFAEHGEAKFREFERAAVQQALTERAVVSLGGGAVLDPATRADLATLPVVHLSVSAEAVAKRLVGGGRPLIEQGGIERWIEIADSRRDFYREVADFSVDTSNRSVAWVVGRILNWYGGRA
ncbi:MAG TPA: shikimate kinase [Candidatus Lumbricidophila sp.]|nr:shikimate kinase [Candidatus Lumbricidophila sp.]